MDIDDKINSLMAERSFLKLEINSKYGTSHVSVVSELFIRRNKITEEITNYATLTGNEITANQFEAFNLNNNKSVMIINKKKLSTYLDNLL